MRIIDAHMHFSNIASFREMAGIIGTIGYSSEGLTRECSECGVEYAVGMGVSETGEGRFPDKSAAPLMGCDLPDKPGFLRECVGVNPFRINGKSLDKLKRLLKGGAAGIKIYPGYTPFTSDDKVYDPVYKLAGELGKTVVVHSGGTFSERAFLKHSRPLHTDRAAVRFRGVNFLLAHMGWPWVLEATEIAYKNGNVYMDLSGLIVGGEEEIDRVMSEPLLTDPFRQGLLFLNDYRKVLYGSDWPLVPMKPYVRFCESLIPKEARESVFYENAAGLFGIKAENV